MQDMYSDGLEANCQHLCHRQYTVFAELSKNFLACVKQSNGGSGVCGSRDAWVGNGSPNDKVQDNGKQRLSYNQSNVSDS